MAAGPGGPANIGGSYLTLTSSCRDPQAAFAYITELLSPDNESRGFVDASIFPAVPAAYALPALIRGSAFFGGQATIDVFGPASRHLPVVYDDARNAAVSAPYVSDLANVEGGKDPERAWAHAVEGGRLIAKASH